MTPAKIQSMLKTYFRVSGTVDITPNGIVNVKGSVRLRPKKCTKLPIKFGTVSGNFEFMPENELETLQGSPTRVGGDFACDGNKLTTLEGAPRHVKGFFECHRNQLISLEGAPAHVGDNFTCYNNQLRSLLGAPVHVGDGFYCTDNPLQTLEGLPNACSLVRITYSENLALLKLTHADAVEIMQPTPEDPFSPLKVYTPINTIMNKYAGQGKPGALKAAAELVRAGFPDNARW